MADSKGLLIHKKAEMARESENFLEALKLTQEALVYYIEEKNYNKLAELFSSRFLIYKHYNYSTKDEAYIVLAEQAILTGVKLSEKYGNESSNAISYFHLAELYDEFWKEYPRAIDYYNKSLAILRKNPPPGHDFPGCVQNIEAHLFYCEAKNGDYTAIERLEQAAKKIMNMKNHVYERDVWASGAYMKLASLYKGNNAEKSVRALQKAEEIINSNPKLTIRKKQLDELKKSF